MSSSHSFIQTLIQVLYYVMIGGERKSVNVRVVGWREALLHHEGQVLDKKRDARGARSDSCVLNSSPT